MNDENVGAVALLESIDLAEDDPRIVQKILSILGAPDYPQLMFSFHDEDTQSPPEKAIKFVNALDKVCVPSPQCPMCRVELHPLSGTGV